MCRLTRQTGIEVPDFPTMMGRGELSQWNTDEAHTPKDESCHCNLFFSFNLKINVNFAFSSTYACIYKFFLSFQILPQILTKKKQPTL